MVPRLSLMQKRVICISKKHAINKKSTLRKKAEAEKRDAAWNINQASFEEVPLLSEADRRRAATLAAEEQSHPRASSGTTSSSEVCEAGGSQTRPSQTRCFHPNSPLPGWKGDKYYYVSTTGPLPPIPEVGSSSVGEQADNVVGKTGETMLTEPPVDQEIVDELLDPQAAGL